MAESMIERVAKAIYEKRNGAGCTPWGRQKKVHQAPYLSDAAAAIEEMRDPSHDMMQAIFEAMFEEKYDGTTAPMIGAGWEAGIDAALKDVTDA